MKYAYGIFQLFRTASKNPDETVTFIGFILNLLLWALSVAIDAAIVALIVAGIAKFCGKDFWEWLRGTAIVWVILEVLFAIGGLIS